MTALPVTACAVFATYMFVQAASFDHMSLLQVNPLSTAEGSTSQTKWPFLVPLDREQVPVISRNKTVSYKTSYSGMISMGSPAQEFRVVFDTGSAHVVVPASTCKNESCVSHRQYNIEASQSSLAINVDGGAVPDGELCDQVDIGYGTGMVTGEFVREQVCLGKATNESRGPCVEVNIVMAVEMTSQPFNSFNFDGIFGLALDSLAMTPSFSFFNSLAGSGLAAGQQFGVFLTEEDEKQSEIALGGYDEKRLLTPLQWAPVTMKQSGYWQVSITEVRINGKALSICQKGTCRGIVDTGTSHIGVPGPAMDDVLDLLSVETNNPPDDCRTIEGLDLEFVVDGNITLTLPPSSYMRPLAAPAVDDEDQAPANQTGVSVVTAAADSQPLVKKNDNLHYCVPRVMPVNFPAPLGPDLFILGEAVLQRYYTVYDWADKRIGFGLAASTQNIKEQGDSEIPEDHTVLVQVRVKVHIRRATKR